MWVMTPYGYTSAVAHRNKPSCVMVRARDKESLEYFCDFAGIRRNRIYTDFPSDYPYRAVVKRKQYDRFLLNSAADITYDNFKNQAKKKRGQSYASVLMSVWSITHRLTPANVRTENSQAWDAYDRKHGFGKYAKKTKDVVTRYFTPSTATAVADDDRDEFEPDADYVEWWAKQHGYDADEVEALVEDVDALLPKTKSVHDMTEAEWRQLMEENPGGI